ncbi:cysteine desulfurase family protein [Thermogemmatispora onikobensis]|uniref:cysteine desulfurase family protein n=1 Tax=Thermogemmatispora onikobensis TaxID=732234 RepID=UPI000852C32B|nr:cysteine desulfurase family protein [Thermogemmatispora onikobensis]
MSLRHPGLRSDLLYLDYNATTPVDPVVVEAMLPYLREHFGNPSSAHSYGWAAHQALERSRADVATLLGCSPGEIIFTGGGSESDNLAIRGVALACREQGQGDHIITQVTEHPAVLNTCRALERLHGFRVTYLPVDEYGRVSPEQVERAIDRRTVLVSVMHANNETGTLQPLAEIAAIAHHYGALMHSDAAQSVGKITTSVADLGVDLLTVAGHKLYAPKGVGALYVRRGLGFTLEPVLYGGGQERGLRAGTESVAACVALGAACRLAAERLPSESARLRRLRDLLWQRLRESLGEQVQLNGHPEERLPNTLNVSISGLSGEEILAATPEVAASTGSACHEGSTDPSPVLLAMGLGRARALGALRLTLGRWSSVDEVERAAVSLLRSMRALARNMRS